MGSNFAFTSAADTVNMQAGGSSFFEDTLNFATKGVGAAIVSGLHSLANTAVDAANWTFGTSAERFDTAATLSSIDAGWGQYYQDHKEAIDTAGFFAGSLIPGTLAVKGLKLAQAGAMGGAFKNVLGFTSMKETAYLSRALTELATEGGTVFQRINTAKTMSMVWGTADQALQVAAYEIATAVTMKSSPMLENEDWKNIGWDIIKTSMVGGAIGGGINALLTNKLVKDAGKLVDKELRTFDVLKNAGDVNMDFGDKAYQIIEAVLSLPPEAAALTVKLNHGRKDLISILDITALAKTTRRDTVDRALIKLQDSLTHVVENDPSVGAPLAASLLSIFRKGLEAGATPESIRARLGEYLWNLKSVEGIGNRTLDVSGELRFFNKAATVDQGAGAIFGTAKVEGGIPYRIIGDELQARTATLGKEALNADDAFKAGYDLVLDPSTKKYQVSPTSEIYKKLTDREAASTPMFFNTVTQETSLTTVPTIADVQTLRTPLTREGKLAGVDIHGVTAGDHRFIFNASKYERPADSIEATARSLWAEHLPKIFGTIDTRDVALMDSLARHPERAQAGLKLWDDAAKAETLFTDIRDFEMFQFKNKVSLLNDELVLSAGTADLREVAYRMNVTPSWIDRALETKFDMKALYQDAGWKQDAGRFASRENLIFRYDTEGMNAAKASPEGIVAFNTRVKEAVARTQAASKLVLANDYAKLISIEGSLAGTADSQLVGAGLLGASNAGYADKLRAWGQYTGQVVSKIVNDRVSAALAVIQNPAAKLLQTPTAAAEVSAAVTAARLSTDKWALYTDYLSKKTMMVDLESFLKVKAGAPPQFAKRIELSDEAGAFLKAHHEVYQSRLDKEGVLKIATGLESRVNPDQLYFPPVDTQRVPFFAFVRQSDGTMFGSSEVAMITARDSGELQKLAAEVQKDTGMRVLFKTDGEAFHKAKADYDFSRAMNSPTIDSTLRKQGKLGTYLPNMTPEAVVEDFVQYHQRAETKLVRDAVSSNYSQTFAELQDLSDRYTASQKSKFEGLSALLQRNVTDPFGDAMKLALNISKRGEFTLWHQANEFVDAVGTKAFRGVERAVLEARGGQISWQEANDKLRQFGLGSHFTDADAFAVAQTASDRNLIKTALQKANMLLANGMLRLDFANSLLNMVSTPILLGTEVSAIRNSLKNDPELFAAFNSMLTSKVPGVEMTIPSTKKLLYEAVANLVKDGKNGPLMARYRDIGVVKGQAAMFHEMIDDLSLVPNLVPSEFAKKVDKWVEKGATLTFSNHAEDYTRFVSANVMHQITEPLVTAGKMSVQEQNAFMSIFVNRVQGNYIASQRPILFQGTMGSAIGLFQTYQFNLFQQLFRHIENRDLKTIAVMGGLQGSLFGANGLPLFDAINTQIVGGASINEGHKDAYSYAVQAAGKEMGDWLMYGTASAFPLWSEKAPALWTRGDLNPRSTFIIPTSPTEVPAVQATLKVVSNLLNMVGQIGSGANVKDALLFGLEHNGINRPLTGLAQILKGNATTSQGALISASQDWDSIANASRLIGAKPMDESIAVSTVYRQRAYQAMDKERIDKLGSIIKDKLRGNQPLTSEDWVEFQGKYAAAGGRVEGFARAVQRWDKVSNVSLANSLMEHQNNPAGKRLIEVMGGEGLPDYRDVPIE